MAEGKDPVAGTPTIKKSNRLLFALQLGFFAGVIWGSIRALAYYLQFTHVVPGYMLEPFFKHSFLEGYWGLALGLVSYIVTSILAAIVYVYLFSKWKGPWPGILFGLAFFVLFYLVLGPMFHMVKPIGQLDWNSIWTDGCLSVLWGVFIGYTAAYEFTDEREHDKDEGMINLRQPS